MCGYRRNMPGMEARSADRLPSTRTALMASALYKVRIPVRPLFACPFSPSLGTVPLTALTAGCSNEQRFCHQGGTCANSQDLPRHGFV